MKHFLLAGRKIFCLWLLAALAGGCTACPPIQSIHKATMAGGGDTSSITINNGIYAYREPYSSSNPIGWCDTEVTSQLNINYYTGAELVSFPSNYSRIAAVDVEPNNITFKYSTSKPSLNFDLKPGSYQKDPKTCTDSTTICYAIFRYISATVPWTWTGDAYAYYNSSVNRYNAKGDIDHFTIYALVELPEPAPLPSPGELHLVVASDFRSDAQGNLAAAFIVLSDSNGRLDSGNPELIFRFGGVKPGGPSGTPPAECTSLPNPPDEFTCLFPIGIPLILQVGMQEQGMLFLGTEDGRYGINFYANPVQVQ